MATSNCWEVARGATTVLDFDTGGNIQMYLAGHEIPQTSGTAGQYLVLGTGNQTNWLTVEELDEEEMQSFSIGLG
tara:strand:+ start:495 stop:719 length:225 start_codon:yes stop_codon:yes gene_type:complete